MSKAKQAVHADASKPGPLVAYYRVSTAKQGASGLGLDAQKHAVHAHAMHVGRSIAREYTEVETSTKASLQNRPELSNAIAFCKRTRATLVIAKLDRLSRNVAFLATLMESKVDFVACDTPSATPMVLHILVAVAEDEAKRISERTKAALAAYKARGGVLGANRQFTREEGDRGRERSAKRRREDARGRFADLAPEVLRRRARGETLQDIADWLNREGQVTTRGKPWGAVQVLRLLRMEVGQARP